MILYYSYVAVYGVVKRVRIENNSTNPLFSTTPQPATAASINNPTEVQTAHEPYFKAASSDLESATIVIALRLVAIGLQFCKSVKSLVKKKSLHLHRGVRPVLGQDTLMQSE